MAEGQRQEEGIKKTRDLSHEGNAHRPVTVRPTGQFHPQYTTIFRKSKESDMPKANS